MAPIKFEDHIREQLEEREIQPSNIAWDKLNKELNHPAKKKAKIPWYAIAASIVGLIVVASLLFGNKTATMVNSDKIIETEVVNIKEESQEVLISKFKTNEIVVETETSIEEKNSSKAPKIFKNKTASIQNNTTKVAFNNSEKKIEVLVQEENHISEIKETNSETDFIDLKVTEVVAQISAIQNSNKKITDEEINALLEKAQLEIQSQRIFVNNKVDATALLNTVEEELEASFRDKVFEALGEQFEKVRTAVVERNN